MRSDHPAFVPSVRSCSGFEIPVREIEQLCIDRLEQGKFAVCVEHEGSVIELACLDSFRDAMQARTALDLLITVLFPSEVVDES